MGKPNKGKTDRAYFREAYQTGVHGWPTVEPSPYVVRFLRRVYGSDATGYALDLGCGEGRHARFAADLGFHVVGVDFEASAVRRAIAFSQDRAREGLHFVVADVLHLPFHGAPFEVVIDYGCLHHQRKRNWPLYLHSVLHCLKPRGVFLLSVFSPKFRMFCNRRRQWHVVGGAYRRCFTREQVEQLFGATFSILETVEDDEIGFWHFLMRRRY